MEAKLPPNILSYIATHVAKTDRISCALVCKLWTEPFLGAYWSKVAVTRYVLRYIFDPLKQRKIYQTNAHRMWALDINHIAYEDIKYIPDLQRVYPKIKYLECYEDRDNSHRVTDSVNWSLWNSLTHLSISLNYEPFELEKSFIKLSVLSGLVHFTLKPSRGRDSNIISWVQFESLHHNLPRLEYLVVEYGLIQISKDDMRVIKSVKSAPAIETLLIFDTFVDASWTAYFAIKYPHLQNLNFKSYSYDKIARHLIYDQQRYRDQVEILSALDRFFPCLKKSEACSISYNGWPFSIFYDTLYNCGEPSNMNGLNSCTRLISGSLKFMRVYDYALSKDFFPKLVELYINVDGYRVEIENILNQFPVLRSLYIEKSSVDFGKHPQSISIQHSLQRLEIKNTKVALRLFNYISLRCEHLKFVKLHNLLIRDTELDESGQAIFDMSLLQLETLIVYNITFKSRAVKHLSHTMQIPRKNWYHVCSDKTNKKPRHLAWELGKRDIEFSQRYCKDHLHRSNREKRRKDMERDEDGYVLKRFWKRDLQYDVLILRLKSVEKHFLDKKRIL
ncbi:hypothetical protein PHYBLDRAFT_174334 [Phycomyces blakesleeanus NRRL 1555(-)]|uniref:F-box domain-containing protein n=1 Tax=Phycomyces blakesleeanus (strain ATCC 8743b / DSM 1359 / FGSC 10004 / NBRC 33097 / NRRL 1555) TaxID=763407 RepID=A0A167K4Y7_PHYB8|nr:hypothetical protein PHYBLDRAFT_174334 [Phycomyces blakesleeanus NRRL 1555(-)]OAD67296.1 hypothetical protein PHYBLDRAFT_174334 [Phycomyces blakesleeanus NRRL 1555(-)]|eukprot:XP_018285336.1 hypothetical protein PHYBLDRAFT_174334 [Phycomyces blakesleeanus NRRL 1555(-)]